MPRRRNRKIDEQLEETFPASDPPSFMGGEVLGAPPGRRTPRRLPTAKPGGAKVKGSKKKPAVKKKRRTTRKRKSR
jgi:hypothetical protein